jgi:hypothetical protein
MPCTIRYLPEGALQIRGGAIRRASVLECGAPAPLWNFICRFKASELPYE